MQTNSSFQRSRRPNRPVDSFGGRARLDFDSKQASLAESRRANSSALLSIIKANELTGKKKVRAKNKEAIAIIFLFTLLEICLFIVFFGNHPANF